MINRDYENLLDHIVKHGHDKEDRTGTGTRSIFGAQMRFDLSNGQIPVITTKKVFWRGVVAELLWFLSGDTNVKTLQDQNVHIWDEWADENGELGPVYGKQWRAWPDGKGGAIDQITQVIDTIKNNPDSRRIIFTAWNVAELDKMALPPCHLLVQFEVHDGKLSCQLYQRSADMFLGVPFNIAQYSLLTHMIAQQTGLEAGEFIWTGGDCHIYNNHFEAVATQLERTPYAFPSLHISSRANSIFDYKPEDFTLIGYQHHPGIKAEVSV